MLKKSASGVLVLESILNVAQRLRLRCFHRLRPCWTNFLCILSGILSLRQTCGLSKFSCTNTVFIRRLLSG